ncbi:MAG: hypothetical protein KBS72_06880 [Bacteroidales bacterium]|nr:hypothetical protein [Candidatus Cacconaster scatequi]
MKKIIFVAAVALALCSCAKTELTGVEAGEMIIGASMEAYSPGTKAALADAGSFTWQTGDAIGVATSNGYADFILKTGAETNSATFSAIYSGTLGNYAVYPADIFVSDSKITIPTSRDWSDGNTNCSMFGNLSSGNVAFKHLGGVVKVTLNGVPADAKKFVFSTPGKKITGEFVLNTGTGTDTEKYIETADDNDNANSSYTLSFTLYQAQNMAFYIPVPCGTYPKFAFKVLGAEDAVLNEFEGSSQQVVNRKDILIMPTLTIGTITGSGDDAEKGAISKTVPAGTKGNYRLPAAEKVILNFEGVEEPGDDVINLVYDGDSQLPSKLWLRVASGKKVNVSGNLQHTTVVFDQGVMYNANFKTAQNTFKIIAPARIEEKLTVKGGNVEISGPIDGGADNVKAIEIVANATADNSSAPVQITLENQAKVGIPEQGGEGGITTSANVVIVNNTDAEVNVAVPEDAPETVQVASAGTGTGEVMKDGEKVTTKPAAAIGTQNFITLSDAINAAQAGQTITLINDVELSEPVVTDKTFTLTLNANISPVSTWEGGGYKDGVIIIKRGGNLTINGSGKILNNGVEKAYAAVKMTQKDEPDGVAAKLTVDGNVTLEGYYYGIVGGGNRHNTEITINGGTIKGNNATDCQGIYHPQDGKLTVNGGTISGYNSAIELRGGTFVINGGTLTCTASPLEVDPNGSGSTTKGAALAIAQHTTKKDINVTVNGGTLKGYKAIAIKDIQSNGTDNVNVTYKAGTLDGGITLGHGTFNLAGNLAVKEPVKVIGKTTLDLGTSKLSAAEGFTRPSAGVIIINRKGDLTVKGTTGSIESDGNVYSVVTLTEKDVDTGDTSNPAKLTVDSGSLIGRYYAISGNGSAGRENTAIVINGGTVKTGEEGGAAIYHPQNGTLTINGGTIESATGIYVKSGSVTTEVAGGTIKGIGPKEDYEASSSGMQSTGDAIVFDNCDYPGGAPNADIKGGNFFSVNAKAVGSYAKTGKDPITGFISGGTFSSDPSAYVARDYEAVKSDDVWTVKNIELPWGDAEYPKAFVKEISETDLDFSYSFYCYSDTDMTIAEKLIDESHMIIFSGNLPDKWNELDQTQQGRVNTILSQVNDYSGWNADFEVSFDKPVAANTVALCGQYLSWADGWIQFEIEKSMNSSDSYRPLKDNGYVSVTMTYFEILTKVITFNCGAINKSYDNIGTTMTVQLRLYENDGSNGTDGETGKSYLIGEYKYTFDKVSN